MDILSRTLSGIRFTTPFLGDMRVSGDLAVTVAGATDARFYYMVAGCARIATADDELSMRPGDFVMVQHCEEYALMVGEGGEGVPIGDFVTRHHLPRWADNEGMGELAKLVIGDPPFDAQILSGVFSIDGSEAGFFTKDLPDVLKLESSGSHLGTWLNAAHSALSDEASPSEPGFAVMAMRTLELLFIEALRKWLVETSEPPIWWRGMNDPSVRRALEAMHAYPAHPWKLEDMARHAGQSRSAFAKSFVAALGETPFQYLRRWRIHLAAAALKDSERSVTEIATEAGYANTYPFVRAFTAQMGMTPSAYRRQSRSTGRLRKSHSTATNFMLNRPQRESAG